MTDSSQNQTGGIGSTNYQVGAVTINKGLTYQDVKAIALDVFEQNMARLGEEARKTASGRAEELRHDFVEALAQDKMASPESFSQPEKQLALLEAQKSYAVSGDVELKKLLVDTVLSIAKEPERSLKSIVLQEALKVLPTLTKTQLHALAVVFMARYVRWGSMITPDMLPGIYKPVMGGEWNRFNPTDGDFRHLEYCRCGTVQVGSIKYVDLILQIYPGLFSKGYTAQEVEEAFREIGGVPRAGLIQMKNGEKLRPFSMDDQSVDHLGGQFQWSQQQIAKLKELLRQRRMNAEEAKTVLAEDPLLRFLLEKWDATGLKSFSLTSVGIAVAHTFVHAQTKRLSDINIWL